MKWWWNATQEPPVPHCNNHEIEAVAKEEKGHQPLQLKWPEIYLHVKTKTSSAWLVNVFRSSPTPETLLQSQSQGTIFEQHRPWKPGGVHASTTTRILHGIFVRARCKRELSPIDRQPSSKQNLIRPSAMLTPLRVPPNRKCLFSLHLDAIHVYHCLALFSYCWWCVSLLPGPPLVSLQVAMASVWVELPQSSNVRLPQVSTNFVLKTSGHSTA